MSILTLATKDGGKKMIYSGNNKDIRILVVDDDNDTRAMIRLMLKKAGFYNVVETGDPGNALKKLDSNHIDLVLLDWWMPKVEGIDVLKSIRAEDKDLPVIMLTFENKQSKVIQALKAGASDYLLKPFTHQVLAKKVELALKKTEDNFYMTTGAEEVVLEATR